MRLEGQFFSEEHERKFAVGRTLHRRGGPAERLCGARTRFGGTCRQRCLSGHNRCLRHAGPHAARQLRERQLRDLATGRISVAEFKRQERRREVNRLHDAWKRDPWLPGSTIDLGEHETRFQIESGLARLGLPVAPAVLDWLRWKYRRLQIDARRDSEWARVRLEEYPRRKEAAGSPPYDAALNSTHASEAPWAANTPLPGSKRLRPDSILGRKARLKERELPAVGILQQDDERLAHFHFQNREVLGPLLARCRSAKERDAVIAALWRYLEAPERDGGRWQALVMQLRTRD